MTDLEKLPIIIGSGWGDVVLGATREQADRFLSDNGVMNDEYDDCYFVEYPKYSILINYNLTDKVDAIFFYNKDEYYEHMTGFPIKTKENIGWNSSPLDVREAYGKPLETNNGVRNNIFWQRLVYNGVDFRFLNRRLSRISIAIEY